MFCFVAFLRGINVGGHTVAKEILREVFESLGFQNVFTYKQSGNIIFEADCTDYKEIESRIEKKLSVALSFKVATFVRTFSQLNEIINLDPFKNQSIDNASFLVTFLPMAIANFPLQLPLIIPKSTAVVLSAARTEVFSVTHGGGEGALPNPFLESKLKLKATTRNMNTIREIIKKYSQ